MKLPQQERASVPREKITNYLLSPTHRDGRSKAAFFTHFGFMASDWEVLAAALKRHAIEYEVTSIEESLFGKRYVIEGMLTAPDGRAPVIRSVWFIANGEDVPRFATAYPLKWRNR